MNAGDQDAELRDSAAREAVGRVIAGGSERPLVEAAELLLEALSQDPAFEEFIAGLTRDELETIAGHLPTGIAARIARARKA